MAEYPSEEGVCEDCHLHCANCAGPGPANCTQCKNNQLVDGTSCLYSEWPVYIAEDLFVYEMASFSIKASLLGLVSLKGVGQFCVVDDVYRAQPV